MRSQAKASSVGSLREALGGQRFAPTGVRRGFLLTLACLLAFAVVVPLAQAATSYTIGGQFGTSGEGEIVQPSQPAVDSTGDLLVIEDTRSEVLVYRSEGPSVNYLTSFGAGVLVHPSGIATDPTSGAIYVSDGGSGQILRYLSDGAPLPTYTVDPTFTSPAPGFEPGQVGSFDSPLAVDPTNGDLLVGDSGTQQVSRFTSSGTFVSSFDGTGSTAGRFHSLMSLAVDDTGDVYAVDFVEGNISYDYGRSVLERFEADGTPDTGFAPEIQTPWAVAFDRDAGNLLVMGRANGGYALSRFPTRLYAFHDDELVVAVDLPANTAGAAKGGIALGVGSDRRVFVASGIPLGGGYSGAFQGVTFLDPHLVPALTLDIPTAVTATSSHLSGSVNPLGLSGFKYRIEYSAPGVPTKSTPEIAIAEGSSQVSFDTDVADLAANNTYTFTLVAESPEVTFRSHTQQVLTPIAPPLAETEPVVDFTTNRATLRGKVNPFGLQTHYYFEYGLTAEYGSRAPVGGIGAVAGQGYLLQGVAHGISGLQPGTTYHYRLIAESSAGRTVGEDRAFTTAATNLVRTYEQISPVEKGASNVDIYRGFQPSPDGNRLAYQWRTAPGGSTEGSAAPLFPRSIATRNVDGWNSAGIDPPQLPEGRLGIPHLAYTLAVSEDLSKALVISARKLAPGAGEGDSNIYLRDLDTGNYTTVATTPGAFWSSLWGTVGQQPFIGGTPDFSHVLFTVFPQLLPDAPEGAIYEWSGDGLRVAGPNNPVLGGIGQQRERSVFRISDDGSTLAIANGDVGLSRDGRYRFFIVADSNNPSIAILNRWDAVSETAVQVASEVEGERILQISEDGTYVYYQGGTFQPGIFVWHEGETSLVAPESKRMLEWRASLNGRFFVFASRTNLTGFDNSNPTGTCDVEFGATPYPQCLEIHRYSVETDTLTCVSCRADGKTPTGDAHIGNPEGKMDFGGHSIPQAVSNDGRVFFDSPDPLSGKDANSARDVYEYDGTRTTLISAGTGNGDSQFDDATPDGKNVYFTTLDQLVGQDNDFAADVYDARVGGGIAAQNPPPRRAECIRDDCKATPNAGPELPFGGSEGLSGTENVKTPARKRCGKGRHARKVKGKSRCVKQHKKQAKSNRRQGR